MTRILLSTDAVGGVWRYSLELARGLALHGAEVVLAVGVVVGGLDRLWSAALGGFAVGFVYGMFGDLLSSQQTVYLPAVVYGSVILVLLLRPAGLFAPLRARQAERV